MASEPAIVVRDCETLDEFRQCVAVQRAVWGWEDEDLIPTRFFVVAHKIEGEVLGAFDPAGRLVGFSLAVPALRGATVYLHSHMLAVLPEYRQRGLGQRLKWEQRRKALARGIRLIEWTFDPLELKNAYFNLERLGAIARRYVLNQYGLSSSPLHRGLPTDRLVAEWWLDSPRVVARFNKQALPQEAVRRRIALPWDLASKSGPSAISLADLQADVRRQFQQAFQEGLAVTGCEYSETAGTYLLGDGIEG